MRALAAVAFACLVLGASALEGAGTRPKRGGVIEIPNGPEPRRSRRSGPDSRRASPRDSLAADSMRSSPSTRTVGVANFIPVSAGPPELVVTQERLVDPRTGIVIRQGVKSLPERLVVSNPGWWAASLLPEPYQLPTQKQSQSEQRSESESEQQPDSESEEQLEMEPEQEPESEPEPETIKVQTQPVAPAIPRRSARGDNNLVYRQDADGRLTAAPAVEEPKGDAEDVDKTQEQLMLTPDADAAVDADADADDTTEVDQEPESNNVDGADVDDSTATDLNDSTTDDVADNTAVDAADDVAVNGVDSQLEEVNESQDQAAHSNTAADNTMDDVSTEVQQPDDASSEVPPPADVSSEVQEPADVSSEVQEPADVSTEVQPPVNVIVTPEQPAVEQEQQQQVAVPSITPAQHSEIDSTNAATDATATDVAGSEPAAPAPTADGTAVAADSTVKQPAAEPGNLSGTIAQPGTEEAHVDASNSEAMPAAAAGATIDAFMVQTAPMQQPRQHVVAQRKRQAAVRDNQAGPNQAQPKRRSTGGRFTIQSIHMATDPASLAADAAQPDAAMDSTQAVTEDPAAAAAAKMAAAAAEPVTTPESRMRMAAPMATDPAAKMAAMQQEILAGTAPAASMTPSEPAAAAVDADNDVGFDDGIPPATGSFVLPNGFEFPTDSFSNPSSSILRTSPFFAQLAAMQAGQQVAAAPVAQQPTAAAATPSTPVTADAPAAAPVLSGTPTLASEPVAEPTEAVEATEPAAAATPGETQVPAGISAPSFTNTPAAAAAAAAETEPAMPTAAETEPVAAPVDDQQSVAAVPVIDDAEDAVEPVPTTAAAAADAPLATPVAEPAAAAAAAEPVASEAVTEPVVEPQDSTTTTTLASDVTTSPDFDDSDIIAIPSDGSEPITAPVTSVYDVEFDMIDPVSIATATETPGGRRRSSPVIPLQPTKCGAGPNDSCEVPNLCTARDGCQCLYSAAKKADGVKSGTCGCSAELGLRSFTFKGISSCGWDVNFGQTTYYEVPRLGTVDLPVHLGKDSVCPSAGRRVVQSVNVEGAVPVTCPRDADFVRLSYKRSGRWSTETCTAGQGGSYVLRTTLRNADRGECYSVTVTTTDGNTHEVVFKYY